MKYSIIIPVYNRPEEVEELLESLINQNFNDFEVIIVEDGSKITCKDVIDRYINRLNIQYFEKENGGPALARNFGAEKAQGDWFIVLDSDVELPTNYFDAIEEGLSRKSIDAFGGPDRASDSFTNIQKAISYSMTSFFTTGGIRGGKKKLDKFFPRSFNMGIRRDVWQKLGGFANMRFGEDIDFSIRIFKEGYTATLFPKAWVYHKRRTDFRKFFRQVFNSGIARINLYKKYSDSLKFVHLLPALFTLGVLSLFVIFAIGILLSIIGNKIAGNTFISVALLPIFFYSALIFIDSSYQNKNVKVGLLSVGASFVQLMGYGMGFLQAFYKQIIRKQGEFSAFNKTFYK